jgi:uncharacterized protein
MDDLRFTWDRKKAEANIQNHGVSFDEAKSVYFDRNARFDFDPEHSSDEDRFILLGLSYSLRLLVVCHYYRESDSVIRIISARKATKPEQKQYGDFIS